MSSSVAVLRMQHTYGAHLRQLKGISRHVSLLCGVRTKSTKASQAGRQDDLFTNLDSLELTPKIRYPLAGEKHLPGSHGKGIPEYISFPRPGLPQAYRVQQPEKYSISEWATLCRKMIDDSLAEHGALLFRGLPLYDGSHFSSFVKNLGLTARGYEGGAGYRPNYDADASTFISTIVNKAHHIEPHNDMSYQPNYPHKVFFYCDIPPGEGCGGLTPVCLGTDVVNKLDPKVVEKFDEKHIRYYHCLPTEGKGYLPWQVSFRTKDRQEVEERLQKMGVTYEWKNNDTLTYWLKRPATTIHPTTGEKVWFNQVDMHHNSYLKASPMLEGIEYESDFDYPTHTTYGDGTLIEPEVLEHIRATKWQCTVCIQLRKTDLVVFDNIKTLHGRQSYTGERRVLVFMSTD